MTVCLCLSVCLSVPCDYDYAQTPFVRFVNLGGFFLRFFSDRILRRVAPCRAVRRRIRGLRERLQNVCVRCWVWLCVQKRWGFPSGKRDQLTSQLQLLIRRMLEPDIMMRNTVTQILASDWLARR